MQDNRITQYIIALVIMGAVSCSGPKERLMKLMSDPENGLVQTKEGVNKSIIMQVLPFNNNSQDNKGEDDLYRVRLTLKTNEKITGYAEMQYMNFEIKKNVYAIQGKDTIPCVIFERIPGISEKEFLYLTAFDKTAIEKDSNANLRICLNDEVAGWGKHEFEVKKEVLKKLKAIKY